MFPDSYFKLLVILWTFFSRCVLPAHSSQDEAETLHERSESFSYHKQCESITVQFCQNIEYNETQMPNILKHQNQKEAALAVSAYFPALKVKCSPDIQLFLCSVYVPVCTVMEDPLPPCKSLCLSVQKGCQDILYSFKLPWPQDLDCNNFPDDKDGINVLCVKKGTNGSTSPSSIELGTTSDSDSSSRRNSAKRTKLNDLSNTVFGGGKDFTFTCPDYFKVPKGYDDSLRVGNVVAKNCGLPCDGMFFSQEEKQFSKIWIGTWSVVCAISCLFTVLTFMLNMSRFRYPERPIIFLSVCYLIVSVIYVLGFLSGDQVACRKPFPPPSDKFRLQTVSTISQGTKGPICTIMFIGLYFFSMASSLWWVILALTWFLAAGLKWGHEAIEANSQYFHLAAWAVPAIKTITILALGKVEGDILTGVCFVGLWNPDMLRAFVLAPLTIYLALGTIFLLLGFVSLFRIRTAMKHDGTKTDKLEKLMLRIGIFSVLYTVPAVTVLVCLFYEQANFDHWMVTWHRRICQATGNNAYLIRCPSDGQNWKPNFLIFMLKYLSSLIVGITSSVWIWSNKTVASWKELFNRLTGNHGQTYV